MFAVAERKNLIPILLEKRNWSAYALAKKTGLIAHNVKSIVDSPSIPDGTNYKTLRAIADALDVTIDELEAKEE